MNLTKLLTLPRCSSRSRVVEADTCYEYAGASEVRVSCGTTSQTITPLKRLGLVSTVPADPGHRCSR